MVHIQYDYIFGLEQQKLIIPILNQAFKSELQEYKEQFSKHDYYDNKRNYELKSRKNKMNDYPTTLLTANKIVIEDEKKLYFIFNFTDKIAVIKYKKNKFDKYQKKMFSRINDKADEKEYYYIPIEDLIIIYEK
jgi:hypothetical protein